MLRAMLRSSPVRTAAMATTVETPMMMPRRVSAVRSLWATSAERAMRPLS
jgi:hypothetical protein